MGRQVRSLSVVSWDFFLARLVDYSATTPAGAAMGKERIRSSAVPVSPFSTAALILSDTVFFS